MDDASHRRRLDWACFGLVVAGGAVAVVTGYPILLVPLVLRAMSVFGRKEQHDDRNQPTRRYDPMPK